MSTEEAVQQELFEAATSPEPTETESAPAETAAPEPASAEPAAQEAPRSDPSDSIPSWRLREEAEARRQAEDRARSLEQRYNEALAHWRQQQQPQQQKAPDFFENPQAAMQAAIQQYFQPIQAEYHRVHQQQARQLAEYQYGPEAVALAERVFMQAREQRMLDPMDYERVVRSPNRFDACVNWYKRLYALHTVGDDPETWWQKRYEEKMADPKFQSEQLERIRGSAATRPGMTKLPPSLSRSTASAPNGAGLGGDLSHESLWANATSK